MTAFVTIFADASFDKVTGAGGWAAWLKSGRDGGVLVEGQLRPGAAREPEEAEMCALANALSKAKARRMLEIGGPVMLESDCTNALGAILFVCRSQARDSPIPPGMPVTHFRRPKRWMDWPSLKTVRRLAEEYDLKLITRHVRGHTKGEDARSYVNDLCDRAARKHMRERQREIREAAAAAEGRSPT